MVTKPRPADEGVCSREEYDSEPSDEEPAEEENNPATVACTAEDKYKLTEEEEWEQYY